MQIKQYLKGIASAALSPVVKALSDSFPYYGAGIQMLPGGVFAWSTSGMTAYNNKIFYAGQNILVRKFTEAPIIFSKKKATGGKKFDKYYSKAVSNEQRTYIKASALDELSEHPLLTLFDSPNTYQSGIEMMEDFWYNYGFGDGFLYFDTLSDRISRNNQPQRIHSLNRDRIQVVKSNDRFDKVLAYKYTCWDGTTLDIPKEQILHLKHWNPNVGSLKGLGVDIVAGREIALNDANNEAQGSAFMNGGRGTLFSSDAQMNADGKMIGKWSKEQKDAMQATIDKDMAGARNNRRMLMTNGMVNVTPYGDTSAELELNAAEEKNWLNIFAIMGIPWALTPVASQSSENSVIVGHKALVTNLIISELRKFDQKLTQAISVWFPGIIACHDLTEYSELAPDLKLMKEVYGAPYLRVNEGRAIFGYDDVEGEVGKAILVPSGLMKIEDIVSNDPFADVGDPVDM